MLPIGQERAREKAKNLGLLFDVVREQAELNEQIKDSLAVTFVSVVMKISPNT